MIKSIDVRAGQAVVKGQQLATLDPTFATADVGQLRQQVAGLKAQIARDEAEIAKTEFHPTLQADNPEASYLALQKSLYDQRAAAYAAQIRSFDAKIQQQQTTVAKLQSDEGRYQEREKISKQVETMRDTLFKTGASSLLNLLTATDQRIEVQRTMEFGHNSLVEAQYLLTSLQADRDAYIQKWFGDTSQDLVTARNNLDTALASLDKATKHQDLVRLTAPQDGVVLKVENVSVGSVLKQGDTLMTVSPAQSPIEAEADVSTRDIGFIRPGDKTVLKFDAFNSSEHGIAKGHVKWISENTFTADQNGKEVGAYYKVGVAIDSYHFQDMPKGYRVLPGATLVADIDVGKRSLARYLIGGAVRGTGEEMR